MNSKEEMVYGLILTLLIFVTASISFAIFSMEKKEIYVPPEREWLSPYPPREKDDE